jgi:serine/threonine-protein kinase ATR
MALGTFSQAFTVVCALLDSFSPKATIESFEKRRDLVLRQNLSWVLNGYTRLRKVIVKWLQSAGSQLAPVEEDTCLQFLAFTRRLCVSRSLSPALPSDMSLASTWAQCLSDLVYPSIINSFLAMQVEISKCLDEFVQTTRQSNSSAQLLREVFLPVVAEIEERDLDLQSMDSCLWVTITLVFVITSI